MSRKLKLNFFVGLICVLGSLVRAQTTNVVWETVGGRTFTVDAKKSCDTKLTIAKGERWVIFPNPTDKWAASDNEPLKWPMTDYRGDKKGRKDINGIVCMALCYSLDDGEAVPCLERAEIVGIGRLKLFANDSGPWNNKGSIRFKVVRLP